MFNLDDGKKAIFHIDLRGADTPEKIESQILRNMMVPEYYGKNLDALHDVLTGEYPFFVEDVLMVFLYDAKTDREYLEKVKKVVCNAKNEYDLTYDAVFAEAV